ncbi:hypothetical protein [Microbacterium sp. ZXX196]|uniref:hypothetical protein n=1 Tax=Microbacterium sp. ZXX196 TaxID=2609291 RepID=UPI0012B9569C|nr:hypothetical protein [Microbacterium sp. ZXX196]MTE24858.1 hypothetical protein [Microbacterium sp. ZXX196]
MSDEQVRAFLVEGVPPRWVAESVGWSVDRVRGFAKREGIPITREWAGVSGKIRESMVLRMLHREFEPNVTLGR